MYAREKLIEILLKPAKHSISGNSQGGYDCTCGRRWDWTKDEELAAYTHVAAATADDIIAAGFDLRYVQGTVTGDGAYTPSDDHVRIAYVGYPLTMIQPGSWAEERLAEINRFLASKEPAETKRPAHDLLMSLKLHRGRDEPLPVFIARLGHAVNQQALEETGRG